MASRKIIRKNMGLSVIVFQCNCSPGFSLQVLTTRSSWLRAFRFNPAASQALPRYPAYALRSTPYVALPD